MPFPRSYSLFATVLLATSMIFHPAQSQPAAVAYRDSGLTSTEPDIEYGIMQYSTTPRTDPVSAVDLAGLHFQPGRGYLDSLLQALNISPTSQVLVFSRTSLNIANIKPQTPRAIYFNDDTYVAWVPDTGSLEIASMDPRLGQVFYTLNQNAESGARVEQQTAQCLRCHDSYSLTGGGVPRFILGSGYTGANGHLVSHEGWILTSSSTPFESRWGGWYVTGRHGRQVHLGNIAVNDPSELYQLDTLRKGNIDNLDQVIDTTPYPTPYSDIVALLVIEHQVEVQNLITRVNYDLRTALAGNPELLAESRLDAIDAPIRQLVQNITEPLVRAMLMVDAVPLTDPVSGSSGYSEWFQAQGPEDSHRRSLRELDLQTRVFRYPLSYLIYSDSFNSLPALAKQQIYLRIAGLLANKEIPEGFETLANVDRAAILSILKETLPEFSPADGASATN